MLSVLNTTLKGHRRLSAVIDMFIIDVIASQVYAYVQMHQIVYINHAVFLCISYTSISPLK